MSKTAVSMVMMDDEETIIVYVGNRSPEPKHTIVRETVGSTYWTMYDNTRNGTVFNMSGDLDCIHDKLRTMYKSD